MLNKVRNNLMNAGDFELLHSRYDPAFRSSADEKYITLTSHNNQADVMNQQQLYKINTTQFTFKAVVEGEFPESMYPVEYEMILKEGAQVMFLKNDLVQKRYYNGKIGVVKLLEKDKIVVACDDTDIDVWPESWDNNRYMLNRADGKLEQERLGTFTQYPLRLAWAITIHKSQGLTFERVMIDAASAFSSGQVYVALSRCTSLEGIVLLSKIPPSAISSNVNVTKAQESLLYKGPLPERFLLARKVFTQNLLEDLFSFKEIVEAGEQLEVLINQHRTRMNEGAFTWVDDFNRKLIDDRAVGLKFIGHIAVQINESVMIETNSVLQKRISDAANHFIPKFENYINELKKHPLATEHKEASAPVNEKLNELTTIIFSCLFNMEYCKEPFSVTSYLQHKLKLATPRFNLSCYASETGTDNNGLPNAELLATLKRWRNMICSETGHPIYMVANQASLEEISKYLPLSKKDLILMAGFGKAKADKYGDDILEMVGDFCERNGLESNISAKPVSQRKKSGLKPKEVKADTKIMSLNLYKDGKSITEISKERNLSSGTIEGHLAYFIGLGELDINGFVSREKQDLINAAIVVFGTASHKKLIENLPPDISYGELRMVLVSGKITQG